MYIKVYWGTRATFCAAIANASIITRPGVIMAIMAIMKHT